MWNKGPSLPLPLSGAQEVWNVNSIKNRKRKLKTLRPAGNGNNCWLLNETIVRMSRQVGKSLKLLCD